MAEITQNLPNKLATTLGCGWNNLVINTSTKEPTKTISDSLKLNISTIVGVFNYFVIRCLKTANTMKKLIVFRNTIEKINSVFGKRPNISLALNRQNLLEASSFPAAPNDALFFYGPLNPQSCTMYCPMINLLMVES